MGKKRTVLLRNLNIKGWAPVIITKENAQYYKKWEGEMKKGSCRGYRVSVERHVSDGVVCYCSEDLLMVESAGSHDLFGFGVVDKYPVFGHELFPGELGKKTIPNGISWYKLEPMYELFEVE
jgi:hypothetical protein